MCVCVRGACAAPSGPTSGRGGSPGGTARLRDIIIIIMILMMKHNQHNNNNNNDNTNPKDMITHINNYDINKHINLATEQVQSPVQNRYAGMTCAKLVYCRSVANLNLSDSHA